MVIFLQSKVFQKMFFKMGVLKNFAQFTRKHLCLHPVNLLKKRLLRMCIPTNIAKLLRIPDFLLAENITLGRVLLLVFE